MGHVMEGTVHVIPYVHSDRGTQFAISQFGVYSSIDHTYMKIMLKSFWAPSLLPGRFVSDIAQKY